MRTESLLPPLHTAAAQVLHKLVTLEKEQQARILCAPGHCKLNWL